jgi:hypothetical protein
MARNKPADVRIYYSPVELAAIFLSLWANCYFYRSDDTTAFVLQSLAVLLLKFSGYSAIHKIDVNVCVVE